MEFKEVGNAIVVPIGGHVDLARAAEMEIDLNRIVEEHSDKNLLLNLHGVTHMSSSGVRVVVAIRRILRQSNRWVRLCALSEPARRIIELMGMGDSFDIYDREQDALH